MGQGHLREQAENQILLKGEALGGDSVLPRATPIPPPVSPLESMDDCVRLAWKAGLSWRGCI